MHEQGSYAQLSEAERGGELVSLMEAYGQNQGDDEHSALAAAAAAASPAEPSSALMSVSARCPLQAIKRVG